MLFWEHAMKLTFDRARNIAYLRFRPRGAQVETVRVSHELNVDLAPDGSVYGIELLNANEQLRAADNGKLTLGRWGRRLRSGAFPGSPMRSMGASHEADDQNVRPEREAKAMTDITYDSEADAVYITVGRGDIDRTEEAGPFIYDVDAEGRVVGIEILTASKVLARRLEKSPPTRRGTHQRSRIAIAIGLVG
jgi:uncharacterized protein YuzE